ncbi:site-specific integrase [uncultured Phocaeicola sp.]|uniref:tyrosine-type recombinase/integrase n=1 Tax=uncultured Phocaeicola sp. TaxID=990718 RepID=UPI0014339728|nr:site-specific integrase [uncultured Phocaeicola sp.]MDE6799392.1 site-specific integrase [Phocaeicola sp.]GFH99897.1 tyrosine recombinase XerC [Bacteroidaceae bacterium]
MKKSTKVRSKRLSFSGKRTLFTFMQVSIASLEQAGRLRTSETYKTALNSFMKFMDGKDIPLNNMDAELMMGYETYLKTQGVSMNTVSFYMRILRATYNQAVDKGMVRKQCFPFKRVYTGVEKTVKRAVPFKVVKELKEMDLSNSYSMELARDMFMFSFYTRGMSFVDMAFLKKADLNNGVLTYRRKKTGQLLTIRWEKCMQDIVDKYPGKFSSYLLPIIKVTRKDERLQYRTASCAINRRLKELGKKLGLTYPLTMYVARHSWASAARGKHIPLSVISEGMGHDSEKTTLIYLAALDTTVIDKANTLVLREFM